jgi:putative pyruvate formate lyase activating enzyme
MALPGYLTAFKTKKLHKIVAEAKAHLISCDLCPRKCGVDRTKNELGFCRTKAQAVFCSYFSHFGEEPPISGSRGSGAMFFSRCTLKCVYCQNFHFSQLDEGREVSSQELANYMCELQNEGCHNINVITPTHVMPQILEALLLAAENGLHIPFLYNTSGYERAEILHLLDGIVDIYLPDMRYADPSLAARYSEAGDYPQNNQEAVKEMFRQVGTASFDDCDLITRGIIIRHLVLPKNIAGSEAIFSFIAKEISQNTYISLMSQYHPCFEANQHPPLDREISLEEYENAEAMLKKHGLNNGWVQESGGLKRLKGIHIKRNV